MTYLTRAKRTLKDLDAVNAPLELSEPLEQILHEDGFKQICEAIEEDGAWTHSTSY